MRVVFTCLMLFAFCSAAEARGRHHHYKHHHLMRIADDGTIVSHPSGCPHVAFCGCGVSVKVFGHPVRELYLASNWFRFPRSAPGAGMVAVRNHHVMYIESVDGNGNATVYDPNSGGHQTRIHLVSLQGYRIVDPSRAAFVPSRVHTTLAADRLSTQRDFPPS